MLENNDYVSEQLEGGGYPAAPRGPTATGFPDRAREVRESTGTARASAQRMTAAFTPPTAAAFTPAKSHLNAEKAGNHNGRRPFQSFVITRKTW